MNYKYVFDRCSCLYRNVCEFYNQPQECNSACVRYMEFDYLIQHSLLPKKLQQPVPLYPDSCDLESFQFLNDLKLDIVSCVEEGFNLYIYSSNCGNGKTSWAVKLLLKYFDETWCGNGFVTRGLFIHVPTFLAMAKSFVTGKSNNDFNYIKETTETVDLVVWDDVAVSSLTTFEQNLLISLIDLRQNDTRANIFTSNILVDDLEKNVGKRLASRLLSGIQVPLRGKDKRKEKAYGNFTNHQ